jgi:hypothetical protein
MDGPRRKIQASLKNPSLAEKSKPSQASRFLICRWMGLTENSKPFRLRASLYADGWASLKILSLAEKSMPFQAPRFLVMDGPL